MDTQRQIVFDAVAEKYNLDASQKEFLLEMFQTIDSPQDMGEMLQMYGQLTVRFPHIMMFEMAARFEEIKRILSFLGKNSIPLKETASHRYEAIMNVIADFLEPTELKAKRQYRALVNAYLSHEGIELLYKNAVPLAKDSFSLFTQFYEGDEEE